MKISGGCFCGGIRYEAEIDENHVAICHCRDCQVFSGSAFRLACPAAPSSFRFTKGEPNHFDKTAESGRVRRMAFCSECGTHLCSLPVGPGTKGGFVSLRIATADNFQDFQPVREVYCDSRVPWLSPMDKMVQFPRMPKRPKTD
jgi:hypothetical protein